MSANVVIHEVRNGAMWIRLNRPDAMNSLTPEVLRGISLALDEAQAHAGVRAVVLTGTGRAFCAGADLKFVREQVGNNADAINDFLQDFLSAEALKEAGLVNQVVDDDQLMAQTQALVEKIAARSPLGLRRMKALVDDGLQQPVDTALRLELLASEAHSHSQDLKEGLAAFEEKRQPRFTGR